MEKEETVKEEAIQPEKKEKASFIGRVGARFRENWIDILSAAILALATIATAWCAYQSARWSGVMTINFAKSNAARTESNKANTSGGQLVQVDAGLFLNFVDAYVAGEMELAEFIMNNWFSDELKAATDAWLALDPIGNPDAPSSPFAMPEYTSFYLSASQSYDTLANSYRDDALDSNQRSDNYVLLAVLFASVLFFAGICTKFKRTWMQISFLTLAIVILGVAGGILFTLPVY
jgi:hypothetical protein